MGAYFWNSAGKGTRAPGAIGRLVAAAFAGWMLLSMGPAAADVDLNETDEIGGDVLVSTGPALAAEPGGNGVVVWVASSFDIGVDGDIFASRTTDGGDSWSDTIEVTTDPDEDEDVEENPSVAMDNDGTVVAVWTVFVDEEAEIAFSRSTDFGESWSAPALLNDNAVADTGDDLFPSVATDGDGRWIAVWQSDADVIFPGGLAPQGAVGLGTDNDIFFATSDDDGATWSEVEALNSSAATDSAADDLRPRIESDREGTWLVLWETELPALGGEDSSTESDIAYARSTNNGETFSAIDVVNTNSVGDDSDDMDVALATDGDGNWVALWRTERGDGPEEIDILSAGSTNDGATWFAPVVVNDEETDEDLEFGPPAVVAAGTNLWVGFYTAVRDGLIFSGGEAAPGPGPSGLLPETDTFFACSTDVGQSWTETEEANGGVLPDAAAFSPARIVAAFVDDDADIQTAVATIEVPLNEAGQAWAYYE